MDEKKDPKELPAVLKRLIEEVRREKEEGARKVLYDRIHNRHNR